MKSQFTLKTDPDVILKLKMQALQENKTAAQIIEEALELYYYNQKNDRN